jgi:hypothetical protein
MSCFHQHAVSYLPLHGVQNLRAPITLLQHRQSLSLLELNFYEVAKLQAELIISTDQVKNQSDRKLTV